jgi:hypothetical protein
MGNSPVNKKSKSKFVTSKDHMEKTFELSLKYLNTYEVIKTARTSKLFYKLVYPTILFWNHIFVSIPNEYKNMMIELSAYTPYIEKYVTDLFQSQKKPNNNMNTIVLNEIQINDLVNRTTYLHLHELIAEKNFFLALLNKYPRLSDKIEIVNATKSTIICSEFASFINKLSKLKTVFMPEYVPENTSNELVLNHPNITELSFSGIYKQKPGMVITNVSSCYTLPNLKKYSHKFVTLQDIHIIDINAKFPLLEELSLPEVYGLKQDERQNTVYISFDEIAKDNLKLYKNLKVLRLDKNKTKGLCLLSLGNTVEKIIMTKAQVHPVVWAKLNNMPNLKLVDFSRCELLGLDGITGYTSYVNYPQYNMISALKNKGVKVLL